MTPQEQLLLQQQQKMAGYPTSDKPAIFPPDNGGQQAAAHPRANMFANWGQNGQGNWAKTANPTASQWVDQQKKSMNIGQNANPEPVAAPYAPGTKVVQQPAPVQQTENTQNTQVNQPITSADDLARAMGYTSPQEEEKLRKASVANQRIMAVADALRHIGNIANTVGYAPSQQFNSPVEMERQRYLQGKALRDKANLTYINYQQAKAAQDAKQRQWEAEYGIKAANAADLAAYRKRQGDIAAGNAASQAAYREGNLARQKQADADRKAYNEANLKQRTAYQNRMAGIAGMNAQTNKRRADAYINKLKSSGGGASGVAPLDTPKGQITPNGRSYSNQLLQMFDYAKSRGLVQESDVAKRLRELGFGKDQSDNVKRQMVMDLLRTNSDLGDYASERLGWSYGANNIGGSMDLGLEDDEDEMDLGLE